MAVHPVENYLKDLSEIGRTGGGVAEKSYYGALEALLNEVGRKLKPRVRCVSQLKNTGAGEPDFGLYTVNQFQRANDPHPMTGQKPERGVIECKPWNDDSFARTESRQVSGYWKKYNLVLVTNYRDFVLIGRDERGKPIQLESFRLAESENAFHAMLAHPQKTAHEHGDRLVDCLRRVMLHAAPLTDPQDLAWFLASYAREARARIEQTRELPALEGLKKGLEEALGMKFEGEKGQHFFLATLVQTLFYGVFSSWVLWCRENWSHPDAKFQWHDAAWTLHVPMIASLFEQIATPKRLKPLGVDEVLDKAGIVLNRVDRPAFFSRFEQEHAVQYFYEPFLKEYDPELRKELGVWYTPPEIVQYQVERVDRVLREELHIADGLADEQVVILDPCCGTGAYLVETLKRIHKTLQEKGRSALTAQKLKKAASERVFGFEILPAPFVISHLQIGLMLRLLGAPFNPDHDERAGVYLTNALTGWEPPKEPKKQLPLFPEMMQERDAADKVKQETPILVILGNPPYNAFAGRSPEEEGGLVDPYKEGLTTPERDGGWGVKKFNLDELYVRFFRIAERRIVNNGRGVVCYISSFSYLSGQSFVVMRKHLLDGFDKVFIDCMNGDSRETGKLTPEGKPDPSVFSTEQSPVGIRVGTAICLMVRKEERLANPVVRLRHFWGVTKRQNIVDSLELDNIERVYQTAEPTRMNRYSFRPSVVSRAYLEWPRTVALAGTNPFNGPIERRGNSLIVLPDERARLDLLIPYLDGCYSDTEVEGIAPAFMKSSGEFNGPKTRERLVGRVSFDPSRIVRYPFKPFDIRIAYVDPMIAPLFSRPAPELLDQASIDGNAYFITRDTADKSQEGPPFLFSSLVCDYDCVSGHARHFPLLIRADTQNSDTDTAVELMYGTQQGEKSIAPNLSQPTLEYLARLGIDDAAWSSIQMANLIWMHALAIGYSPAYLNENADGLHEDWPRIPLPKAKKTLQASAALGRRIAALLDTENPVEGVTAGKIDPRLKDIAAVSKVGEGNLNPDAGHLDLTAGWGHAGKGGVCMPGTGKHQTRAQPDATLKEVFGAETLDIYLNDIAYWSNVAKCVWEYHIGGYQVIKKWLSYREKAILGRGLRVEEAEYVTEMARRIAALILMQPELDANYEAVKSDTWPWPLSA